MAPPSHDREWFTPRELAAREGISRTTLWRWAAKGLVTVSRLGPRTGVRVRPTTDRRPDDEPDDEA